METKSPSILILGGGVAGMAAALALNTQKLSVHLVEEQNHLGGKAALWACMATDTCKNCGACLSQEMVQKISSQNNITLHLNAKIHTLKKTNQGVEALLTSGKTIVAARVIMATGFSVFDPAKLPSLHWADYGNVITTAQLNKLFREGGLKRHLKDAKNPRIAFIQCVGSRNRKLKKDYCSQVCCKISLRHSQKLIHEIPTARITLFYMDLQIIGKETRRTLNELSQQIELVQGVPAEILEETDTHALTMVTEEVTTQSRMARQFDLVVLSVGMDSAEGLDKTAALLEAAPNGWGFFNTREARLADDLYIVGCAAGPKDILSSKQEGTIAGAKVLEEMGLSKKPDMNVAILGSGPQADMVARAVSARGYRAYTFGAEPTVKKSDIKNPKARILALEGTAGNFSIYYENQDKRQTLSCGAIIAAPDPCPIANAGKDNFKTAINLDSFTGITPENCPQNTLILLDYFGPEFKSSARTALMAAMAARKIEKDVTILMNKMLVHSALGQRLYDQARKSGIRFLRFNTPKDIEIKAKNLGFHILLKEATLPGLKLSLEYDCLVLPESIRSCPGFEIIANFLRTSLDREGFLQPANVRHRLTQSPRKGIFFTGTGHDEMDENEMDLEIQDILSTLGTLGSPIDASQKNAGVRVNEKECAKCLTCYRICPHAAIILNEKMQPQIMENACFSCHLCVSNCPAHAIESDELTNDKIAGKIPTKGGYQAKNGQVVIFACERSAALAADKIALPEKTQLISIPCACRISCNMILKSLISGASKIIVGGCHEGNCRSMEGSKTARTEVSAMEKMPGITPGQIAWEPVAANENCKFQRIIGQKG